MPIDRDKAAQYAPGQGVLVTLTPVERRLINEAFTVASNHYQYTGAEDEIIHNLLRRIPDPRG